MVKLHLHLDCTGLSSVQLPQEHAHAWKCLISSRCQLKYSLLPQNYMDANTSTGLIVGMTELEKPSRLSVTIGLITVITLLISMSKDYFKEEET